MAEQKIVPQSEPSEETVVMPAKDGAVPIERPDPLARFREQVRDTWLPKLSDDDLDCGEIFLEAEQEGLVSFRCYTPQELHALEDKDRLLWKEAYHYEDALAQISFPIDVERSFDGRGEGPVLVVRELGPTEPLLIVNGNHRVGAAMREDLNPERHPIFVVEFANPDVYAKIMGIKLSPVRYMDIETQPGGRPR